MFRRNNAWLYLEAHNLRGFVISISLVAASNALFGTAQLALPSAWGVTDVPFRKEVPVIYAALAVGVLYSHMADFESLSTRTLSKSRLRWLLLSILSTLVVAVSIEAAFYSIESSARVARSYLIWTGFSLVSGRLLGWRLSWVFPVLTVFPLVYYGHGPGGTVYWWDWTSRPAVDPASWSLVFLSAIVGGFAYWWTPWRAYRLRTRDRLTIRPS